MKFTGKEIQIEIDRIQKQDNTPQFMLVTTDKFGYYLDENNTFRHNLDEEAFFSPQGSTREELLTELAQAIIEQSL